MEYRHRNLQWRTGLASGAQGEAAQKVLKVTTADQPAKGFVRCRSWPSFGDEPDRRIWMLSAEVESNLKANAPRLWKRLQTHLGQAIQYLVLMLVVGTYAACPLTVSWAKIVGFGEDGLPIKGRPFKEGSVIVVSWLLICFVGLSLSFVSGGWKQVRHCFDLQHIIIFAPAGIGWAMADVCEVLAVARIDPATYGVLSQGRLLSSAAAGWIICGAWQTGLQWGILACLSLICMAYCLVPDESRPNAERLFEWRLRQDTWLTVDRFHTPDTEDHLLGGAFALAKVTLSVLCSVYVETCFKSSRAHPMRLHVQMTQVSFSSIIAATTGYLLICILHHEDPSQFFSGQDGSWTQRTLIVAAMYCWREWICSLCVKHFDSLVKNICNAVSLVVTYMFTVAARETDFSILKAMLLVAIVLEVINYCFTRTPVPVELPVNQYKAMLPKDA
ncbi:Hypothetical protein SCF082_LOCUS16973 [Durusdinium trenchii]|uniref:Uncharacterized protein n=1 Tax=Durusdinium trenchii TaxID=1381693 RepID=A0ABP0KFC2_9DINO